MTTEEFYDGMIKLQTEEQDLRVEIRQHKLSLAINARAQLGMRAQFLLDERAEAAEPTATN